MTDLTDLAVASFLNRYLGEIDAGNAAIFAGAGLSAPAGYVDWRELLRDIADDLGLCIDLETDLVSVAQFHFNEGHTRFRIHDAIVQRLPIGHPPAPNHRLLARLPIRTWWTTNYDQLIETALREAGKIVDVKSDYRQLAITKKRRDAVVYKMHGDVERPDDAVVTRDDYEAYGLLRTPFVNALTGDLVSKTFLFIGFSFTDPNLDRVLAQVRLSMLANTREHYAFFRRRTRHPAESSEAFAHGLARQRHVVADLKRYGVNAILVDEYSDIDAILAELERRYRRQSVFISSCADDFAPWGQDAVEQFMRALGDRLIDRGFRLATGLGTGVGNALLTGAIERILSSRTERIEDRLIIRPFPQHIPDAADRERVWAEYRQRIVSEAGIALFLFGNKLVQGSLTPAAGIEREWEIARALGLVLVPVGATGSIARTLAERALAEPDIYLAGLSADERDAIAALNRDTADLTSVIGPLMDLIVKLRRRR